MSTPLTWQRPMRDASGDAALPASRTASTSSGTAPAAPCTNT
jgi:hypothetical protein